jgi:hypothetical protein
VDANVKSGTISSNAGDPTISKAVDPIASTQGGGAGACATVSSQDQGSGVVTLRVPPASGNGYTLLGSPTVIATLNVSGNYPYIAARLWDVDPHSGQQTLVARGVYRVDSAKPNGLQVFQLHPGSWHFAGGHIPKLELLGQDPPYVRKSNGQFSISLSNVELRLPVHEVPGAPGTPPEVRTPKPHVFPNPQPACNVRPSSRIAKRRTHMNRRRLVVRGTSREHPCAFATRAQRRKQRVARVRVEIYRGVGHGRCRFVSRNGRLSGPRRCSQPIWLRARGIKHWTLRKALRIPPGRYVIRADAVDRRHRHQRRSRASVMRKVRVR